jgi:hypothetical protein
MDVPAPKHNQYFKLTDDQTGKVQDFLRGYFQDLRSGDRPTIDTILSTIRKEYPELRLSRSTFARNFAGVLESHKKDAGLPIRRQSERLSEDYIALTKETFLNVLSSVPVEKFKSILFNDLLELAHEHSPDLELNKKIKSTLLNHFKLQDLKRQAISLRPHRTPLPLPEDLEPALGRRENDLNPANEGPCIVDAQGLGPRAADAARGGAVGAAAERMRSPVPAMGTGDPFSFTGEYHYRRRIGGMHLGEDASVSLEDPPAPASVSDGSAGVEGLCDGADCDGRASMEAGAAATGCEGPAAVAVLPATGEAAEATAASGDSKEAEGPGGNGSASVTGGQVPIAPALDLPAAFSSESMIDVGTQGLQDEMQCDSGDLTDFTPCICCVEITYDKALVCICSTQCIIPNAFKNLILSMLQEMQIQSLQT